MSNIITSSEIDAKLKSVDLIVFDIDGVLINTKNSFISTTVDTTKYFINNVLEISVDLNWLNVSHAYEFKGFSGFNNDWILTTGLVTYCLIKNRLNSNAISINEFLKSSSKYGAGLIGLSSYIKENMDRDTILTIKNLVSHPEITRLFQELYAGDEYCERLYDFTPQYYNGVGSIHNEEVLLDINLLSNWNGKIGILTGRAERETDLALEMVGLANLENNLIEYSGNGLPDKPEPDKMVKIIDESLSDNILYLGDTLDDYLTVENYNKLDDKKNIIYGMIKDVDKTYTDDAVKFSADSVNDILKHLFKHQDK